jgi:hypothetical protein
MLKDRVAELKATRDQARVDAERAQEAIDRVGPSITPQTLKTFARTARKRMRTETAYEDIAEFFTNDIKEINGVRVYGHMDYGKKDPSLGWRLYLPLSTSNNLKSPNPACTVKPEQPGSDRCPGSPPPRSSRDHLSASKTYR